MADPARRRTVGINPKPSKEFKYKKSILVAAEAEDVGRKKEVRTSGCVCVWWARALTRVP